MCAPEIYSCEGESSQAEPRSENMWHPNVHGMVNEDERREEKFIVPSGWRAREKYAVNFHMPIWSEKLCMKRSGRKLFSLSQSRGRHEVRGESSFSHGHTHHREIHNAPTATGVGGKAGSRRSCFNGSWGL
jgi:UDP-2,3-diacylglucosamine pyrophosphatase LpxH